MTVAGHLPAPATNAQVPPHDGLNRLARTYTALQCRYNGARPEEVLVRRAPFHGRLHGEVPYWDLPADTTGLVPVGELKDGPFWTGTCFRVYHHYLSHQAIARTTARYGPPAGRIRADMTSAYRTLMLYPEDAAPMMLKFSGHEVMHGLTYRGGKLVLDGEEKRLHPDQVIRAVARSIALNAHPAVMPEPAGLLLDGEAVALYRPMPQMDGDGRTIWTTWHVLMDPAFQHSDLGQALFAPFGGFEAWAVDQAAALFAQLIWKGITRFFMHFEYHSQNIDVVVARDGCLKSLLIKDLSDGMMDPAARAAAGHSNAAAALLRQLSWGDVGAHLRRPKAYDLEKFYRHYFGQSGLRPGCTRLQKATVRLLLKQALRALRGTSGQARLAALQAGNAWDEPFHTIAAIRHIVLETRLMCHFVPDAGAETAFAQLPESDTDTTRGYILAPTQAAAGTPRLPAGFCFGYAGDTPTALRRAGDSIHYYMRLP